MPDRSADRLAWTRQTLADPTLQLEPASADASFRSYWRTQHQGRSWIVMDSPPAQEDPAPWLDIGARLSARRTACAGGARAAISSRAFC